MSWPHDPDSPAGSKGRRRYGMAILASTIDRETFPLPVDEYCDEYGEQPVRIDSDTVVSVASICEPIEAATFEDPVDFYQTVGNVLREKGFALTDLDR